MKVTKSRLEWLVIGASYGLVLLGVLLSWLTQDPTWMSRAGSLLIVLAILVASIKLDEVLGAHINKFRQRSSEDQMNAIRDQREEFHGEKLGPQYEAALKAQVDKATTDIFATYIQKRVVQMKAFEVKLLVAGTLINGFGDKLMVWTCLVQ
ncbi:hypothetical protein [Stutzerimonas nitrititolerans]|uniref:Uncharacterized protein n=1 Tax=Stutzerimonas nitrititolerans TaxID=2482751 RepID=A0ABX9V3V2_9GAMM|nr:hypothetical protein [Stutzerimonas nitrititolerans]RMI00482.1 hypothetical protein EA795_13260 [Stutzerimonas nitrititolerans]